MQSLSWSDFSTNFKYDIVTLNVKFAKALKLAWIKSNSSTGWHGKKMDGSTEIENEG